MSPIIIDGCFGWLHTRKLESSSIAVVLCPGLKFDELTGYSSWRLLADALADQGYPTLRLHYLGTGDSRDSGAVECWTTWQQNIHGAAEWLRENCAAERIVLCGLRFGAVLAATVAASRIDVAGLVLLAPVLRGRSYIRQLTMETGLSSDGYVDVGRFRLSPDTTNLINQVELRDIRLTAACKVVVFSQASSAARSAYEAPWKKSGVEVTSRDFTGLEPMLRPTFAIHENPAVIDPIVTWLCSSVPASPFCQQKYRPVEVMEMNLGGCVETPLSFGPDRGLFGILCRPDQSKSRVVVLMGNSSGDPHCAGTTVNLARHLAAGGVASLRFDFSGIGDSVIMNNGSHVFETDRSLDFSAAIDALERLGYREFAAQGLCSGAYHAYHAAVADQRIGSVLLINLPFFKWTHGFPVEELIFDTRKPSYFVLAMRTKTFWTSLFYKLLHGDLNVRRRIAWLERELRQIPIFAQDAANVTGLAKRVRMLFLVGEGDVGVEILRREFGSRSLPPGTLIQIVPGLDHAMNRNDMRAVIGRHMVTFLEEGEKARYLQCTEPKSAISPPPIGSARRMRILPNRLISDQG